ncbi:MAG: carbon starvation protein A [Akkermansiaceae bacterium]
MSTLAIALGSIVLYYIAYHTYGKWIAQKLFRLNPAAKVPSIELEDGVDYVPSDKKVIFGHHFTSIAGTGPIVGPALAVIWGWVPALIWVLFGSILIGAVHDFGALVVSLRSKGQTVGDIAGRVITTRTRILFLSILFLALTIVLAIFGLVIAAVFKMYPASIFPCLVQIPLAILIGLTLHRKGINILIPSIIALVLMLLSVAFGNMGVLGKFNVMMQSLSVLDWCMILLAYCFFASVLPVWTLLQPRDFINSLQLLFALGLVALGLVYASFMGGAPVGGEATRPALEIVAPSVNFSPEGAPPIFPFLFITIACGAISGFHCLVSSGTSSKQLKCETDAQFIGFGSMLTEGFLAVLVILACVAGIGLGSGENQLLGVEAYDSRYSSWAAAGGLPAKVGAFVEGSANFLKALGIAPTFAVALMGVFVASFAATTLDTACRLQRYVVQELAASLSRKKNASKLNPLRWLTNRYVATIFAIVIAYLIARLPGADGTPGKGGTILWPLFGAINQLLAGLSFLVITFWLRRRGMPTCITIIPGIAMLLLPFLAMSLKLRDFSATGNWLLFVLGFVTIMLEIWMIVEAALIWKRVKNHPESPAFSSSDREGGRSC